VIAAALPPDEEGRLRALRATGLLALLPDSALDALVQLASQLCQVPIALVSLVDETRQCFPAKVGLAAKETSREVAFCAHAILTPGQIFEVEDATQDVRFFDNPLVLGDPKIRFYAGVPLVTEDGHALGTLCVIDRRPRRLDDATRSALRTLADQVMAQVNLRKRARELEALNDALHLAWETAEASSREKLRLMAFVSHEFRTPMNGILGMSSLLLASAMPTEQREMVEAIHAGGQRLLHLLNQFLDFSCLQLGQHQLRIEPIDLVACVDSAVELVQVNAQQKHLQIWVDVDPNLCFRVEADEDKLRQVFVNLLGNAIKFSAPGILRVELGMCGERRLRAAVIDQGPGFPPSLLPSLFQPFARGAASKLDQSGTGLGLAICRHIIELHGGTIEARNLPEGGACLSFELPVYCAAGGVPRPLQGVRVAVQAVSAQRARLVQRRLTWWGATLVEEMREGDPPLDLLLHEGPLPPEIPCTARSTIRLDPEDPRHGILRWSKILARFQQGSASSPPTHDTRIGFDASLGVRYPLKILLAEDNPINQRVAAKTLERLGYRARVASDGQQVLEMLDEEPAEVVLMDVHMPILDGLRVCRILRARGSRVQIVAMTASASQEEQARCMEAGMDDFLSKPILIESLTQVLRRAHARINPAKP
jgi:signal transduction histidine kinase/ActR/RegA family two-component response regulator